MAQGAPRAPAHEARGGRRAAPRECEGRRIPPGLAPYACAAANVAAAIALATILAPGTPLGGDHAARAAYVAANLGAWRAGWALWIVAALTLLWLFVWWSGRVRARRLGVVACVIAALGLGGDVIAESVLMFEAADDPRVADAAFVVTGAFANGLYTVAGVLLTIASRFRGALGVVAWTIWAGGALIAVGALTSAHLLTAAATAVTFLLLPAWCVALARALR